MLKVNAGGDKFQRSLTIRKMRGTPVAPGEYPFDISPHAGIVMQNRANDFPIPVKDTQPSMFEHFELPNK